MMPVSRLGLEIFEGLEKIDGAIAAAVAAGGCRHCGGPLHRGNYLRKPRGGLMASVGEGSTLRHSLCCGWRGCRKRSLPPSLRFLGRRVYLEAVVILGSVVALAKACVQVAADSTGVPARTLRRWGSWWRDVFPATATWADLRARFVPPAPDETDLPRSLLQRLQSICDGAGARDPTGDAVVLAARHLAPETTQSVADGSRFVRAAFALAAPG
mgnify:CR=1 FL=1